MNNELFGESQPKIKAIQCQSGNDSGDLSERMRNTATNFAAEAEPSDDITLWAVQNQEPASPNCPLRVKATLEKLPQIMGFIENIPDVAQLDSKSRNQLFVAVEEIYVNIIHYAYRGQEGDVIISFDVISSDVDNKYRQIRIHFCDSGPRFNPLENIEPDITLSASERDIGGLGIFIVRKTMDFVDYQYIDGQNILTIGKNIS
ncbi:MAG: ATP-binding protein [Planctomycetia bacterium]|nr:ATP-binding protein [Planctomycetia bacterium]